MLLEFFLPVDHELQICPHPKPRASIPICLKHTEFKTCAVFFCFILSLFSSSKSAEGSTCGTLNYPLLWRKHFCLSLQSLAGEWSWWAGDSFKETLKSNNFHMQKWLGRCRTALFITHTWKYMLMLAFVKPCDKLPVSGTWLFSSFSVHWFQLSAFFPASAFQKNILFCLINVRLTPSKL